MRLIRIDVLGISFDNMIEKEAANDSERAQISSVIYNRLSAGMPLGIDATIQYALPEHKDKLTADDLKIESPYNTRLHTGLPPTPIASPGMESTGTPASMVSMSRSAIYMSLAFLSFLIFSPFSV